MSLDIALTLLGSRGDILRLTGPSTEQNHTLQIGNPNDTSAGILNLHIGTNVLDVNLFGANVASVNPFNFIAPYVNPILAGLQGGAGFLGSALANPITVVGGLLGALPVPGVLAPIVNVANNVNILNLGNGNSLDLTSLLPPHHS